MSPSPEDGNRSSSWDVVFSHILNSGRWTKSRNPAILSGIHHCQNPLDSINRYIWLTLNLAPREAPSRTSSRVARDAVEHSLPAAEGSVVAEYMGLWWGRGGGTWPLRWPIWETRTSGAEMSESPVREQDYTTHTAGTGVDSSDFSGSGWEHPTVSCQ
jgi:hypothetical protein